MSVFIFMRHPDASPTPRRSPDITGLDDHPVVPWLCPRRPRVFQGVPDVSWVGPRCVPMIPCDIP